MPHIMKEEWDVMAQLAFQLYSKQNAGAGDELFMVLIEKSYININSIGLNLLRLPYHACNLLFHVLKVRRTITEACVDWCITWGCEQLEKEASQEDMVFLDDDKILKPAPV